ncbi:MAG: hypothetical protein AB1420_16035 [Bacillota bacterium]
MNKYSVAIIGLVVIGLVEIVALMNNVDGILLSIVVGTIAGIIGLAFGKKLKIRLFGD